QTPQGRRTWMCGVFGRARMALPKIPSAPRTRREASGAEAGCAFFAPGFFAQAKKGGSRRHGAKALDVDPTFGRRGSKAARCARALIRPAGTFSRMREKGFAGCCRAAGILTQSFNTKEPHPMAAWFTVVAPFLPDIIQMAKPMFTRDKGADQVPRQIKELQDAATQNAGAVKQLAGEMQRTLASLQQGASQLD